MNLKILSIRALGYSMNFYSRIRPQHAASLGLDLFCLPFAKKLHLHQKKYLQSAHYTSISLNQNKVEMYRWGVGPKKILFLHGWASHSYRWKNYIEALSPEKYSVYAIDAPAHGLSSGRYLTLPLYSELIQLAVEEIGGIDTIIGHSFGGYAIVNWIHIYNPSPDTKVVLLAAPGEVNDFMDNYQNIMKLSVPLRQHIRQAFYHRIQRYPEDFSTMKLAQNNAQPALIVHDQQDTETSYIYSENLSKVWKNSQFILTNGLGHGLKSKEVLNMVCTFIQE